MSINSWILRASNRRHLRRMVLVDYRYWAGCRPTRLEHKKTLQYGGHIDRLRVIAVEQCARVSFLAVGRHAEDRRVGDFRLYVGEDWIVGELDATTSRTRSWVWTIRPVITLYMHTKTFCFVKHSGWRNSGEANRQFERIVHFVTSCYSAAALLVMQSAVTPKAIASVCLSVTSHAGTLSRRMKGESCRLHCEVAKTP